MSEQPPPLLPAVSVAIHHDGRIPAGQARARTVEGPLCLPGRAGPAGRADEEAVRRELAEETGPVGSRAGAVAANCSCPDRSGIRLSACWSSAASDRAATMLAGDDADEVGWFSIDEMEDLPVIPSVLETARAIVAAEPAGLASSGES